MSYRIAQSAVALFVAAAGTLFLTANHAPAQCQKSGQTGSANSSSVSGSTGTASANAVRRQGRNAFQRQQQAAVQNAFRQQAALQQLALQQQAALQNMLLQQQLYGVPFQPQPPQQQNTLDGGRQRQQPQHQRFAQADSPPPPQASATASPTPVVEDPETAAERLLRVARTLAADAETASDAGKGELSASLRLRAAERIQRILGKYADTQAADAARELMRKVQ